VIRLREIEYTRQERPLTVADLPDFGELAQKIDYPDWDELKRIAKKGLLLGVDYDAMDYAVIPWETLTRHVGLFGVTGAGKTFFQLSLLSSWVLEKAAAGVDPAAVVVDNLGNFLHVGLVVWKRWWKEYYSHLGTVDELEQIGRGQVRQFAVKDPLQGQEPHYLSFRYQTVSDFLAFLVGLGANITESTRDILFDILSAYLDSKGFLNRYFSVDAFLEDLRHNRSAATISVIDTLNSFIREYGDVFRRVELDRRITVSDGSRSPDRWLFHYSLAMAYYSGARKTRRMGTLNFLLMLDEYNDILDDSELKGSVFIRDRREGYYATLFRSFILRLWREGRNYGYSTWIATQSPFQLLVKEGRRLGNLVTRIWGYLGADVEKMQRLQRVELTKYMDILLSESRGSGWIARPRTGQFIIESDDPHVDGVRLKIFPPLYLQKGRG